MMVVTLISSDGDKMLRQWWCCREDNDCENDDGGGWIWQFSHKLKKKKVNYRKWKYIYILKVVYLNRHN
jgi:hypothetical protein